MNKRIKLKRAKREIKEMMDSAYKQLGFVPFSKKQKKCIERLYRSKEVSIPLNIHPAEITRVTARIDFNE